MQFRKADGGTIKLSQDALNKINIFLQIKEDSTEAGGIMLGRFIIDSLDIIIDDVTTPSHKDTRQRYLFIRTRASHQRTLNTKWRKSKGTTNYLGEWHTHPERIPTPSPKDINQWKKALKEFRVDSDYIYFLIAGIQETQIWEGNRATSNILKLEKIKCEGD